MASVGMVDDSSSNVLQALSLNSNDGNRVPIISFDKWHKPSLTLHYFSHVFTESRKREQSQVLKNITDRRRNPKPWGSLSR